MRGVRSLALGMGALVEKQCQQAHDREEDDQQDGIAMKVGGCLLVEAASGVPVLAQGYAEEAAGACVARAHGFGNGLTRGRVERDGVGSRWLRPDMRVHVPGPHSLVPLRMSRVPATRPDNVMPSGCLSRPRMPSDTCLLILSVALTMAAHSRVTAPISAHWARAARWRSPEPRRNRAGWRSGGVSPTRCPLR